MCISDFSLFAKLPLQTIWVFSQVTKLVQNFRMSEEIFIHLCNNCVQLWRDWTQTSVGMYVPLKKRLAIALWKLGSTNVLATFSE